jgi:hypothetical protein|nr:MAG TPA: YopX protein [Caudoviricetes sp.]
MIPKFRVWHRGLGRMMLIKNMWFQDGSVEELELNDAVMNDYITAYPDEIELMQSTGLKDKNGKEIFEGDILYGYAGEDFWEIVEFDTEEGKWIRKDIWYNSKLGLSENNEFMEIVGNIYENPELLEVE